MIDGEKLRLLIRDVIEAEVASLRGKAESGEVAASGKTAARIESDADLAAFAQSVLHLAEDQGARARILAGTYPFRLAGKTPSAVPAPGHSPVNRLDQGVLTEQMLAKLPKGQKSLMLGPGVVVTPLARERARALGIQLERRSP